MVFYVKLEDLLDIVDYICWYKIYGKFKGMNKEDFSKERGISKLEVV